MVNPTGYTALDMIGFTDKGAYSSSDNYVKNDLVHYSGNIWRCLIDDTTGIAPAEGVNWTLFIGEPTNLVERIIAPVETDPATNSWTVGRQIIFNDNLYEVIVAITAGDALVTYEDDPTNANIKLADPVETQLLDLKGNLSNRNLLDNAWFTVNQRGFTSTSANEYTVDRWKKTGDVGNVSLDSDGCMNIYNDSTGSTWINFQQILDEQLKTSLQGKTCTLSVMLKDGTIKSTTGIVDFTQNASYCTVYLVNNIACVVRSVPANSLGTVQIAVPANTAQGVIPAIKAIKLELGSVSTLAMDIVPNYAEELLKCQRYCYVFSTTEQLLNSVAVTDNSNTTIDVQYAIPVSMRINPTLTMPDGMAIVYALSGVVANMTEFDSVTLAFTVAARDNNLLCFRCVTSGLEQQTRYKIGKKTGRRIIVSADL